MVVSLGVEVAALILGIIAWKSRIGKAAVMVVVLLPLITYGIYSVHMWDVVADYEAEQKTLRNAKGIVNVAKHPAGPSITNLPQSKTTTAAPKRVRHFTTGQSVNTIACSPDGKLIAIANGNPTFPLRDGWKPAAEILDAESGNTVVSLKLTTDDEDTLLDATERDPHFEVKALAFSPDGNMVAVGTSIGQVKLFNARTGELLRSLDDEQEKLADKKTPEKFSSLKRAMGSVASLAFSPDGSLLAACGGSFDDVPLVRESIEQLRDISHGSGPAENMGCQIRDAQT